MVNKVYTYPDHGASMQSSGEMSERHFAKVAVLIGEKSRAVMLWNLIEGKEYTDTELAD